MASAVRAELEREVKEPRELKAHVEQGHQLRVEAEVEATILAQRLLQAGVKLAAVALKIERAEMGS